MSSPYRSPAPRPSNPPPQRSGAAGVVAFVFVLVGFLSLARHDVAHLLTGH